MSKSWEQILGGYATNTLTDKEKRRLFEAALHDQELFDAMADEEALKTLLADPKARQRILASLQVSQESHGIAPSHRSKFGARFSWFRQPSSLAWAGSLAAMGLALIFGWQMQKDWGPMVQQEQQAERSRSEDRDNNGETFRSQASKPIDSKMSTKDLQKNNQKQPERVAGLSDPVPASQPSTVSEASSDSEGRRQSSALFRSEDRPRQVAKKEDRSKAKASMPQPPDSAIVKNILEEEQLVASSEASPEGDEEASQQFVQPPSFEDKLEGVDAIISPKARELDPGEKSQRVDAVEEEFDSRRALQPRGGMVSQVGKALTGQVSDVKDAQQVVRDYSQGQTRGIRYYFVRPVEDGKAEALDIKEFSGKWSELHLAIESNVSGYFYVLTSFGKGKWQRVRPGFANVTVLSDGAIKVKAFQSVNFALSQVTNTIGKPVVSSITVLLSSTPLTDLGKWLGNQVDIPDPQIVRENGSVFVIDRASEPVHPIKIEISLK